jgi:glycine cleavage system H protein
MDLPENRRYTPEHEWLRVDADDPSVATVGITDFAQDELGDVVFVAMPKVGTHATRGQAFGEIESVKTVSELFAPVGGEVIAVNEALTDHPELVNSSPYDDGWMIRIRLADPAEVASLLDAAGYRATLPAGA